MGENERERNNQGRYADGIDPDTVLDVFDAREDRARPITAGDVVDELGIARRTAHNKLNRLVERGVLDTRKVGARGRVFWRPIPADGTPRETSDTTERRERDETAVQSNAVVTTTENDETKPAGDTRREDDSTREGERETQTADEYSQLVADVVDSVADSWDDDGRRADRKAAARAVIEYAVTTGDHVGESTAVDEFRDEYPVAGQNATTWWRQNAREVLSEVGDYSRGHGGYRATRDDLKAYLEDSGSDN